MKRIMFIGVFISFAVTAICLAFNFKIAEYIELDQSDLSIVEEFKSEHIEYANKNITVVGVQYVTEGTMWHIIESSDNNGTADVLMLSLFDLRCSNKNINYNIDHYAGFITVNSITVSLSNKCKVIIPIKTYIFDRYNSGVIKDNITIQDLRFIGIIKIFIRSYIIFSIACAVILFIINLLKRFGWHIKEE